MINFNVFVFLLMVMNGPAKAEPNTCGCILYVYKDGVSNALVKHVLSFVIPDFAQRSKECNDNTVNKCKDICVERVSHLTNNMELEKQPKGDLNINVSFGQFVCNKFGDNIENETLGVFAYMHCNETHSEHGVNVSAEHTQTLFTGLFSQQFITCRNSLFITQSKQSSSTAVPNSSASNTSPKPHSTISSTKASVFTTSPKPHLNISSTKASIFSTKGFK